eukprot:scaffold119396_cov72-Phaeocystis_antarctica.AAC.5
MCRGGRGECETSISTVKAAANTREAVGLTDSDTPPPSSHAASPASLSLCRALARGARRPRPDWNWIADEGAFWGTRPVRSGSQR